MWRHFALLLLAIEGSLQQNSSRDIIVARKLRKFVDKLNGIIDDLDPKGQNNANRVDLSTGSSFMLQVDTKCGKLSISRTFGDWQFAVDFCKARKMKLLSIETEAKFNCVSKLLNYKNAIVGGAPYFWISLNKVNKTWVWDSTGKNLTFSKWGQDQPDNFMNLENCASFGLIPFMQTLPPLWNDVGCIAPAFPICE
ncbi:L-selectin-like [Neocloeon triangulifer]|uniref:L-selectin-like n=1 Tax=Neocloeon triangulifer TaxID=2078957 RepID=UPI00286EED5D|nr:L-selectin-like [Neocloeon triangulifer]